MRYMMFVVVDPSRAGDDGAAVAGLDDWFEFVTAKRAWVAGDRLRPTSDATTVRVQGGDLLVTDGPFTESKEWICGFNVLECADLDEAIEIAAKHPMACAGRLELRPFWPIDED
jgi:hypothetical protein